MNFSIIFNHPWLLLLLVPAIALVFIPHLRLSRKYRRTRNRIISLVLMSLIMVLSVSVLAGATFNYTETNYENELILLVDVSDSSNSDERMSSKNVFIQDVLRESSGEYKTCIVKFANGYVAGKMGYNTNELYRDYLSSSNPATNGTDLASALTHVKSLITKPEAAKVVILSDGIETDGEAMAAVMSLILEGTRVDTVYFGGEAINREYQINSVKFPDHNIFLDEEFTINLTIQSTHVADAKLVISDNGDDNDGEEINIALQKGVSVYPITHKFTTSGAHEIRFTISGASDKIGENNMMTSYYYLEVVDRILIIQRDNEAEMLENMLKDENNFTLSERGKLVVTNFGEENCPTTVEELTSYDQVILMNIANADMPSGFIEALSEYVSEFGGGLLTIGGSKYETDVNGNIVYDEENNPKIVANTYAESDMKDANGVSTEYAKMLPIETGDYTPPLALMFVIDTSQSMRDLASKTGVSTKMDLAKKGAIEALNSLSPRDYVGVVSFNTLAKVEIGLTPYSERQKVADKINQFSPVGKTMYGLGIDAAGDALTMFTRAKKKHIIFITDGEPSDANMKEVANFGYMWLIRNNEKNNISMSVIDIGDAAVTAGSLLNEIGSAISGNLYPSSDIATLSETIRAELTMPLITDFVMEKFTPQIAAYTKVVEGITRLPELDGYFGVTAKSSAVVPITGDYAPLYAQWSYGKGKVGSFMCDLNGYWSGGFFDEININEGILDKDGEEIEPEMVNTGAKLLVNIIRELFPIESIKYNEIKAEITKNNFRPVVQVDNKDGLPDGEYYEVKVSRLDTYFGGGKAEQTIRMSEAGKIFKCEYKVSEAGIYFVTIQRKDRGGRVLDEYSTYTTFSYSAEYNSFVSGDIGEAFMADLATRGGGSVVDINAAGSVLEAVTDIPVSYDPRVPFIIAIIILFLLDVAVRKFKFKWPWEIVRMRREKKEMEAIKARRAKANIK